MGALRVLLAVSVFMAHSRNSELLKFFAGFGGENSVEIFFLISGFYIAMILDKSYSSKLNFYINRALRLYPMYFIICSLVLIRSAIFPEFRAELFSFPFKALCISAISNLSLLGSDLIMFLKFDGENISFGNFATSTVPLWKMLLVPQAWSLGIEITFYLFAPMICKFKIKQILFLTSFLLAFRILAFIGGLNSDPWTYRFLPFELPLFLIGVCLYKFKEQSSMKLRISMKHLYVFVLAVYLLFPTVVDKLNLDRAPQLIFMITVASIVILASFENTIDKKVGDYSYPIYMTHVFILSSYDKFINIFYPNIKWTENSFGLLIGALINLTIILIFSRILIKFVQPIENMRKKYRN